MKLLIWNFSQVEAESSNFGDRAIFRSLVVDIKQIFPKAEIFALSSQPQLTSRLYGVNAFHFKDVLRLLAAIRKSDIVILGGGEFIQDKTSLLYLVANLSIGSIALALRKPIAFIAIGVADEDEISVFGRFISRLILNKAKFITVRDQQSKRMLRKLKVTTPTIHVSADAAFRLPIAPVGRVEEILRKNSISQSNKLLVGVAPRRMLYGRFSILPLGIQVKLNIVPSMYNCQNRNLSRILADVLDDIIKKYDADILFIPMYQGKNFSYRDQDFAADIKRMMNNKDKARILIGEYSAEELKGVFSRLDLLIGMTLHSLIMAVTTRVPIAAISYSSKMNRFAQSMGQESYLISLDKLTARDLSAIIEKVLSEKETIRKELGRRAREMHERAFLNIKVLSDCLTRVGK